MSKKLIAVAAAAALGLSGLVGIAPATAMPYQGDTQPAATNGLLVTSTVTRTGTGTLADPYKIAVPSSGLATSGTTLRFKLSATASRPFTVSSTSGIKVLATVSNTTPVVLTGSESLSGTTDAQGAAEFFAYPTSTTRGVVTLTFDGSDITQVYITGNEGSAYDIGTVTLPSLEPSKEGVIVAVVTDAFGNAVTSLAATLTATRVGTGSPSGTDITYSTTTKRWEGTITAGATAGQLAVGLTIDGLTATAAQKAAFGDPNNTFFGIINVATAPTVAALQTQVAALTAQLANSVSKAKYNKLAKRWNKAFPSNKVKLQK